MNFRNSKRGGDFCPPADEMAQSAAGWSTTSGRSPVPTSERISNNSGAAYPSPGRAGFAQFALAFVALVGSMDQQVIGLLVEPIKQELQLSDAQVGLAFGTAYFAAYGLIAIPAGLLADRVSRTRLVLIALILNCSGLALAALSHSLGMLMLAKGMVGVYAAIVYPAAMSLLADFFPPEKRAFGTLSYPIGQTLGGVGALLIGGLGYSALVNAVAAQPDLLHGVPPWRTVSIAFAVVGLLTIPVILALREPARMELGDARKGSFIELWAHRKLLIPMFLGLMGLSGASSGIMSWVAPVLMRLYKLQPGDFAAVSSIVTLSCSLVSFVVIGKLINWSRCRGGHKTLMLTAMGAAALCIPSAMMALMPNVTGFAILCTLYMLTSGIALGLPVIAIGFEIPNELRGLCMGVYCVLIAAASMVGAPLAGYIGGLLGGDLLIGHGMAIVAAPFLTLTVLSFWMASRYRAIQVIHNTTQRTTA